jgi:hypothetical protein
MKRWWISAIVYLLLCCWLGPTFAFWLTLIGGWTLFWFWLCGRYPILGAFSIAFLTGLIGGLIGSRGGGYYGGYRGQSDARRDLTRRQSFDPAQRDNSLIAGPAGFAIGRLGLAHSQHRRIDLPHPSLPRSAWSRRLLCRNDRLQLTHLFAGMGEP